MGWSTETIISLIESKISSGAYGLVDEDIFDMFVDKTKEQVYLLRDEDKRLQGEIDQLKELMQEIVAENKKLKEELQNLKSEKDKNYYSLDL